MTNMCACFIFISFLTFNDRKKETVCKDQPSARDIIIETSQSHGWGTLAIMHVGLEKVEVLDNEVSEKGYKEIDNIFLYFIHTFYHGVKHVIYTL